MRLVSLLVGGLLVDTAGVRAVYHLGGILLCAAALAGIATAWLTRKPVRGPS